MPFLQARFPENTLEVQFINEEGEVVSTFATESVKEFDAEIERLAAKLEIGDQIISFRNAVPTYVVELDFDGNEVTQRL